MVNCEKCGGTGWINYEKDGYEYTDMCDCQKMSLHDKRIEASGLKMQVKDKRLDNFKTETPWQKDMKIRAESYIRNPVGWFVALGQVGCGKTHLCTAIAYQLLKNGKPMRYMQWRTEVQTLKDFSIDGEERKRAMNDFKNIAVLYVDDLFKGSVSDSDISIAFDLLNHRYNNRALTIISCEKTMKQLSDIDSAISSRIYEMSKGYLVTISPDNWKNQRFL